REDESTRKHPDPGGDDMHRIPGRAAVMGLLTGWALSSALVAPASAAEKLRLLIVDGQNNHAWKAMTPPMKADLERTGRFTVDVVTTPPAKAPKDDWSSFR